MLVILNFFVGLILFKDDKLHIHSSAKRKKKQLCVLLLIHPFNLMVIAWNEVDIGQDCN